MKTANLRREQKSVDRWNAANPSGTSVIVVKDDGSEVSTKTRSPAQLLGGHTAVVWLDGISGAYLLERVRTVG